LLSKNSPPAGDIRTLLETDYVRVSLMKGGDRALFISMTGIGHLIAGMPEEEFIGTTWDGGANSCVFVSDLKRTWYNDRRVLDEAVKILRSIVEAINPRTVVAIGNSMGGFGAIVLSSLLRIDTVIGFVPQYSIDPAIVPEEKRWTGYRSRIAEIVYKEAATHFVPQTEYYLFHGSDKVDAHQSRRFPRAQNIHGYVIANAQHNLAAMLKSNGHLRDVIDFCIARDTAGLDAHLRKSYGVPPVTETSASSAITGRRAGRRSISPESETNGEEASVARNTLEIQTFGLQRSGNHAVVAWILQQYDRPMVFLNNVAHFEDPYLNFRFADVANAVPLRRPADEASRRAIEKLRMAQKELLLISFENLMLPKLASRDLIAERERSVGQSSHIRRLLILRDFYNWIASRVRLFEKKGFATNELSRAIVPHVKLWIVYAREFIGETNFLGGGEVVPLSFNRWLNDEDYRAHVLGRLRLPLRNNSRAHVPNVGGGSSFDETRFSGDAESMNLLGRWRHLEEPPYAAVLDTIEEHAETIDRYNSQIFGLASPFQQSPREGSRPT